MRITVTIDDALYARALEFADLGIERADLLREALCVFVRVNAAKRLARLGGAAPQMQEIRRRRLKSK
jgi:Arc/MetJ family transcription regulator